VNGSRDLDATNSITLAKASGTGNLSSATGLTQSLSSGVYLWADVQYDTEEDFTIEAQTTSLTNKTSAVITCEDGVRAWINEFHYDNAGTDADEIVEICLVNASGYTLSDFTITLYNGNGGASYDTKTLNNFTVGTTYDHVTVYSYTYPVGGIQNGSSDGIALSYDDGSKAVQVLEFISYEGTLTATDGPANGLTSTDVGVSETSSTTTGTSIGRVGENDEWSWEAGNTATAGTENNKSGGGTQVLPISLISFTFEKAENAIVFNWQTASETNNDYFTLERSLDAVHFQTIGIVRGAGNSNIIKDYQFIDNGIEINQIYYYRLKQTDYDGKFSYSRVIIVNPNVSETQLLKNYIANGNLIIDIQSAYDQNMQIDLFDISGKLIQSNRISAQKGRNNYRIQLQSISKGIYLMRVYSDSDMMLRKLFVE
jgi:hypothetical protein